MDQGTSLLISMDKADLLCLRCRGLGHVVNDCPSADWKGELDWFFSAERATFKFDDVAEEPGARLCERCSALDILSFLQQRLPWTSQSEFVETIQRDQQYSRWLGKTGSIEFSTLCSLCRCLFALTPNPSLTSQDVVLTLDSTLFRLAGETGVKINNLTERNYANCLLVTLGPSAIRLPLATRIHRGDALCLLEEDRHTQAVTLGGRKIERHSLNLGVIQEWLRSCDTLHGPDCNPQWTKDLNSIRLLDVDTRQVVEYPNKGCEYIALSYVIGVAVQQKFELGVTKGELPRTIEDAIVLTRQLRKKYLWVDSMCIDQANEDDKRNQINKMWSIYRGALFTIVSLSGASAGAGLPKFSRGNDFSQAQAVVNGKRLVGLMPTLSQQIWVTSWGRRAWTLQEGILSPRCLYLSDHQMNYECSVLQSCESLDQTRSWAHNVLHTSRPLNSSFIDYMFGQVGAGCLRNPLDAPETRLEHWGAKLTLYSYRTMTREDDGLNAFHGILQRLKSMYHAGFFWGLPIEDLDWGLLWQSHMPMQRRLGFPTWSWAGWKGHGIWPCYPFDVTKPRQYPVHLKISNVHEQQAVPIFNTTQTAEQRDALENPATPFAKDPVQKAALSPPTSFPSFETAIFTLAEKQGWLLIEAITLTFLPDFSKPQQKIRQSGQHETFLTTLRSNTCAISIMSTDREITNPDIVDRKTPQTCLLVARDRRQGEIHHHLLLVHHLPSTPETLPLFYRGTWMDLIVPEGKLDVLEELNVEKRRLILV